MAGLEGCKTYIHDNFLLSKRETPIKIDALKTKLQYFCKPLDKLGLISFGKGYYEFTFSLANDLRRIQSQPSMNCKPYLL